MNAFRNIDEAAKEVFSRRLNCAYVRTDRAFAVLFALQWLFAIVLSLTVSPSTWIVDQSFIHVHIWAAIVLGGALTIMPICLVLTRPGAAETRYVVSVAQMGYSALLIHLTGGRIETHFHVFGSLAFLSVYRDWRVLIPATVVIAVDHAVRGIFWPESVFGVLGAAPWRVVEHAGWVVFEVVFLVWSCRANVREMKVAARVDAKLECTNALVEQQVKERTAELVMQANELETSLKKSQTLEVQLLHAQKLESMGQLAAGIAHEINTPMQCVEGNVEFLKNCYQRLFNVVDTYANQLQGPDMSRKERQSAMDHLIAESRCDHIRKQAPAAIEEAAEAVQRVIEIVRAMKAMSHPGNSAKSFVDINNLIRSAATISRNRWKFVANVQLELQDSLADVPVMPAEVNQVLLNMIVNATDAIGERYGENGSPQGKIVVRTSEVDSGVQIEIEDDGCGIPEGIQQRIFDPFFTTKDVGKGTGQGLAITYDVVVKRHGGRINVDSTPDVGTTFTIWFPYDELAGDNQVDEESLPVVAH